MRERALSAEEQVLAQATRRDIQAAGGLEVCAAETGLSTSQLSRCQSNTHADSLSIVAA
jgi:DNA-binding phage protein